ncbi:MAG: hypothetical protein LR001_06440 [Clostridiales bacterium]|nr:hypothetical protein [Clostridiales bacterium]
MRKIKINKKITDSITEIAVEIKIYNNELHIESEMDEDAYVHVRVYNPKKYLYRRNNLWEP